MMQRNPLKLWLREAFFFRFQSSILHDLNRIHPLLQELTAQKGSGGVPFLLLASPI